MNQLIALFVVGFLMALTGHGCSSGAPGVEQKASALRFKMKSLSGEEIDLARYEGKVVMIVNVASKCGYTPQYEQLQALHEKYADQGLAILGFPCNQFLGQEPGSAAQIAEFCRVNYGVTFDLFAKVDVNGPNACPLYQLLTTLSTHPKGPGKIGWNFEKFILDRKGFVVARFASGTKPDAPEVVAVIEEELGKPMQPAKSGLPEDQGLEAEVNLTDYRWKNRILLLFAASDNNETYKNFRKEWDSRKKAVNDRDLLLVELLEQGDSRLGDKQLAGSSVEMLREQFKIPSGSTNFILIGKDGTEKLRTNTLRMDALFELIDAMPMRKREAQSRNSG